ncbi:MAG: transglycosylase domain-containing protein [Lachnospiraceae bacterium]|nr:transglycosylase domain-containing protein [Lachnospiraceae bacterium]
MNYGKKGVKTRQKELNSTAVKLGKKAKLSALKVFLLCILGVGIIGMSAGIGLFKGIISSAPDLPESVSPSGFSSFVYDIEGKQTAKIVAANSNRIPVNMSQIPEDLAHAFVAIEDERFYEHNGIDIQGIIRAGVSAIKNGELGQGASTITQQLLKNNVFQDWVYEESDIEKIKRKIQEQYLAIKLEKTWAEEMGTDTAKDKILENYLNTINLGQNTLGVQAASLRYFNKPAYELTLSECAVIAGITQNPSRYNPISHPEENAKRRKKVLSNMLKQGYITQEEHDEATADNVYERIQIVNQETENASINTYFVDAVIDDVYKDLINVAGYTETQAYNLLYTGGISIYSTQDPEIQAICDEVFSNEDNYPKDVKWYLNYELTTVNSVGERQNFSTEMLKAYFKAQKASFNLIFSSQDDAYAAIEEYKASVLGDGDEVFAEKITLTPQPQVAITIEDQSTGHIVAMVGGRGPKEASRTLNRATDSKRQPGSTFKILSTFAPALDSAGMTLASVQNDAPFNYENGAPVSNWYSHTARPYWGLCSLRYGIEQSLNIVTVKTLTQISPQLGFDYLLNFGFTTLVAGEYRSDGKFYTDIQQATALGGITDGVYNLELTAAYATIANHGTYIKPKLYTQVVDHDGNVILDNTQPEARQVLKETTAYLLTDAMVDCVTKGTGTAANFANMSVAGKTGTTSDNKDSLFAGFTPYYTSAVWIGYDNNVVMNKSELALSKSLWRSVMSRIHENLPNKSFDRPAGLVSGTVCSKSGKLPIAGICDLTLRTELFAEDTYPTETCDVHYQGMVCQYSLLPAEDTCPFKAAGILELAPIEPASLQSGSMTLTNTTTDPLQVGGDPLATTSTTTQKCPHNLLFMAQPNIDAILEQQKLEMTNAAILAQQQAEALAAQQAATGTTTQ